MRKTTLVAALLACATEIGAQTPQRLSATIQDKETHEPIVGASVRVTSDKRHTAVTDAHGAFSIAADEGLEVEISYLGYDSRRVRLKAGAVYQLSPATSLPEVVVTATEAGTLTSASRIDRHAMEHLQPSSFTDVLELLPGGMARDPSLSTPNTINLREVPIASSQYATSSLGTAFVIDGAHVSTNANMQYLSGAWDATSTSRDFTNEGVDMRAISTDDIESVEIVRGIPSVEYGELTSGLVNIKRKRGGRALTARFKADMDTKLFHVGKGFEWQPHGASLNLSADYLDNRADPRNLLENYSRATFSARAFKRWEGERHIWELAANADYGGSFDRDKVDPELNYGGVDRYAQSYNRFSTNLTLTLRNRRAEAWLRSFTLNFSASAEKDVTERTRLVQLDRETPAATTRQEGESDAWLITPYTYSATQRVEGIPVNFYAKAMTSLALPMLRGLSHTLKAGVDWQMDKNYGKGQIFDEKNPLYPGVSTRPRAYSDIPASHIAGAFAELTTGFPLGSLRADVQAGVRATTLLNLPASYALHGKVYADPRLNAGLTLPPFRLGRHDVVVRIAGGVGQHTKAPTLDQLFPDKVYMDLVELNYYHPNRDYRRIYLQTYVIDPTNRHLQAARNLKWEVSLNATWHGNRLSVDYFRENMTSGFRSMAIYDKYDYKKYDTSGIDPFTLTDKPDVATLPYTEVSELYGYSRIGNGSQTLKRGVELTMATRRFPVIHTRLTVTGAWFRTEYRNSQEVMERPSDVVAGRRVNAVGIYRDDDGYIREMYNTNFTLDTDLPRLRLGLSLSAQCVWLTASQNMPKENVPTKYMDADGNIHPYTEAERQDVVLAFLVRTNNSSLYERQTVPFSMNLNLKATKKLLRERLLVALFVNKLWDAHPSYVRNNFKIRRYVTPYFGLELNLKL